LRAVPKGELSLQILYDRCCFDADTITHRLAQLQALLNKIACSTAQKSIVLIRLSELAEILPKLTSNNSESKNESLKRQVAQNFKMTKRKSYPWSISQSQKSESQKGKNL
jgi:hypothetical protein